MANLVITSTANSIRTDFNDLAVILNVKKAMLNKDQIINLRLNGDATLIRLMINGDRPWLLSYNGATGSIPVDSVDGVGPFANNDDLFAALIALKP